VSVSWDPANPGAVSSTLDDQPVPDDDYVCTRCTRNQCERCTERGCGCCAGVPED
jgi:hypothetical protein